jgi:hypothetical protein
MIEKKRLLGVIGMNLQVKVKVFSRFAERLFYPKEVGAKGVFRFAPTPVDKCVKSLIYKETEVGARGATCPCLPLAPTLT